MSTGQAGRPRKRPGRPHFGVAGTRAEPVHRVRETGRLGAIWLCGGMTWFASLAHDPAEFGGAMCKRCDALFFRERITRRSSTASPRGSTPPPSSRSRKAAPPERNVVYRCYSADGRLLYIGSCRDWAKRRKLHMRLTPWWREVRRVTREPQPDLPAAREAERIAIRAEAPLYNKQHNIRRFRREGPRGNYAPIAEAA